ncbi:glycosyl transferase [Terrabacter tumescens]|uniref:Glycosyl transferase n=1 Tax=Terrabacter tumescens TaxID=60443 RepID=A0ABQ2I207_9MICO|nr:glycosyltransferase [Terrabacter tumescens]GGM98187.1 glycosyl transferase [Terrabacter tumescens]
MGIDVDVCIVTYKNEATIGSLLESVAKYLPTASVIIQDNSPDDLTRRAVEQTAYSSRCTILDDVGNVGFGAACNRIADNSDAEWLVFINPDAEISKMDLNLERESAHSILGPIISEPGGEIQRSFGPQRTVGQEAKLRLLRTGDRIPEGRMAHRPAFVSGAAMAVRRLDFLGLNGFDHNNFFMYYEDIDLCRRAQNAGMSVTVTPSWRVTHLGGYSAKMAHLESLKRSHISATNYHRKWNGSNLAFQSICLFEAALKCLIATTRGHVGRTSRPTQWAFFAWLVRGNREV